MFNFVSKNSSEAKDEVVQLFINEIIPNRQQPRNIFNDDKIADLAKSIKEHGVIQPIIVRKIEEGFELIAGERRFRASISLGLERIPAIVRDYDDITTASVAIIENIQREDLTSIEEALAYKQLMDLHGMKQAELAIQVGKGQSTVANKIRLLNLSDEVQDAILKRTISERHARSLLIVKDIPLQIKLLEVIIEKDLNVSQTEKLVEETITPKEKKENKNTVITKIPRSYKLAMNTFNQAAMMVEKTGMNVNTITEETEDAYVITISLPKK